MSAVSMDDLRGRLEAATAEQQAAEGAAGAVVLDGGDEVAASERVNAARAEVERLQRAVSELQARTAAQAIDEEERANALARWRLLAWHAEALERLVPVLKLRAELDAAEQHMMALGGATSATGHGSTRNFDKWREGEYQAGRLVPISLPHTVVVSGDHDRFKPRQRAHDALLTLEDCATWARRLAPLVESAATEVGADVATPENLPWEEAAR
jgi:hypothetical protein